MVTALTAAGLDPRIGLFHRQHGAHAALASDLQEEFRHMVDAQFWTMIRRREAKLSDFAPSSDGRYPCLMNRDLRRRYLEGLERRLTAEFKPRTEAVPLTYRAFMCEQARSVRDLVLERSDHYEPLMLHA